MDEKEFKATYAEFNDRPCVFAKAILTRCCGCDRSQRVYIAEREAVACHSAAAQARCAEFKEQIKANALFALRMAQSEERLPHGKEMKVQCGGLLGLARTFDSDTVEHVVNINGLIERAVAHYGTLAALPYTEMVKTIVKYQPRKRGRRHDSG